MTIYNARHFGEAVRAVIPAVMSDAEADARGVHLHLVRVSLNGTAADLTLDACDGSRHHTVTLRAARPGRVVSGHALVTVDELRRIVAWIEGTEMPAVELVADAVTGEFQFYIPMRGAWDVTGIADCVSSFDWLAQATAAVRS